MQSGSNMLKDLTAPAVVDHLNFVASEMIQQAGDVVSPGGNQFINLIGMKADFAIMNFSVHFL